VSWDLFIAVLTAGLTLGGAVFLFHYQENTRRDHDRQSLAIALLAEINGLSNRFDQFGRKEILETKDGDYWRGYFRPAENLFPVYDCNTDKLGLFPTDLVEKIVDVYCHAKGFVSRCRAWDERYGNFERLNPLPDHHTLLTTHEELAHFFRLLKADAEGLGNKVQKLQEQLPKVAKPLGSD